MPRPPRLAPPGALHHITARAPKGLVLFRADADRRHYLDLLAAEVQRRLWSLRTYCLMGNHLHLLVRTPEADLSVGIKRVHETFARDLHRTYETHGHVFGSRFRNGLVLTDDHYLACLRYIARNPVDAGLCNRAEDWPWSAHRALAGLEPPPRYLDPTPTYDALGPTGYIGMVNTDNATVIEDLARVHPSDWMARAVDDHFIPVPVVAAHLGVGRTATYHSLAQHRDRRASPFRPPEAD